LEPLLEPPFRRGKIVFGDGSVRFLPYSASSVLPMLSSFAGGEVVDSSKY